MQKVLRPILGQILTFILVILVLPVHGQDEILTTNINTNNKFGFLMNQTVTSSAHQISDYRHSSAMTHMLRGTYRSSLGPIDLTFNSNKDLTGEREFNLLDSSLRMTKSVYRRGEFSLSARASVLIPTSENSRDNRQLYTATTGTALMVFSPRKINGLTLIYLPSVTYYFNEYKVALTGSSNFQYRLGNTLVAFYSITNKFSSTFITSYNRSFTYQSNTVDQYLFDLSGSYALTNQVGIDLGVSNGGSPLTANGQSNQIRIYDSNDSTYYLNLSLVL